MSRTIHLTTPTAIDALINIPNLPGTGADNLVQVHASASRLDAIIPNWKNVFHASQGRHSGKFVCVGRADTSSRQESESLLRLLMIGHGMQAQHLGFGPGDSAIAAAMLEDALELYHSESTVVALTVEAIAHVVMNSATKLEYKDSIAVLNYIASWRIQCVKPTTPEELQKAGGPEGYLIQKLGVDVALRSRKISGHGNDLFIIAGCDYIQLSNQLVLRSGVYQLLQRSKTKLDLRIFGILREAAGLSQADLDMVKVYKSGCLEDLLESMSGAAKDRMSGLFKRQVLVGRYLYDHGESVYGVMALLDMTMGPSHAVWKNTKTAIYVAIESMGL